MWYIVGMIIALVLISAMLAYMAVAENYSFKSEDKWFVLLFTVVWPLFIVVVSISLMDEHNKRHPNKTKRGVWF